MLQGVVVFSESYGYGHVTVVNASHITRKAYHTLVAATITKVASVKTAVQYEQVGQRDLSTGAFSAKPGAFTDSFTVVKTKH
jgi:hypothetical protein